MLAQALTLDPPQQTIVVLDSLNIVSSKLLDRAGFEPHSS
jgi:hypothetical protein